jgi:hypothetical protein
VKNLADLSLPHTVRTSGSGGGQLRWGSGLAMTHGGSDKEGDVMARGGEKGTGYFSVAYRAIDK